MTPAGGGRGVGCDPRPGRGLPGGRGRRPHRRQRVAARHRPRGDLEHRLRAGRRRVARGGVAAGAGGRRAARLLRRRGVARGDADRLRAPRRRRLRRDARDRHAAQPDQGARRARGRRGDLRARRRHRRRACRGDRHRLSRGRRASASSASASAPTRSNQRGNVVDNFVADGPYQPEERPFIAAFVPAAGLRRPRRLDLLPDAVAALHARATASCSTTPSAAASASRPTARPDRWSVERRRARDPLPRLRRARSRQTSCARLTEALGKQPPAAAPLVLRAVVPARGTTTSQTCARCARPTPRRPSSRPTSTTCRAACSRAPRPRSAGAPSACTPRAWRSRPTSTRWSAPATSRSTTRRSAAGVLTKNALGQPYQYRYTGASQFLVGQFDFSAPGANAFYGRLLGEAVAHGYDGWMEDFGEYTPPDSRSADGMSGRAMHNLYPTLYHRAAREYAKTAPRPLARFNRSGWTGAARDVADRLGRRPHHRLGLRRARVRRQAGADDGAVRRVACGARTIGGFFALGARELTPELLTRWIEVGVRLRRDAHGGQRHRRSPRRARAADLRRRRPARLAPLREAAHAALPVPRGGRQALPGDRAADHVPPGARLSGRRDGDRASRTSSSSGRTSSPRRC